MSGGTQAHLMGAKEGGWIRGYTKRSRMIGKSVEEDQVILTKIQNARQFCAVLFEF